MNNRPNPRSHSPLRVAVDCRLMQYRKAGIAQYTRRLVQALSHEQPKVNTELSVVVDRRDKDLAWLPAGVRVHHTITPAHHRLERFTLPLELALMPIDVLHSPDFIAPRGRFRKVVTIHDLYFLEHPEAMSAGGSRYYSQISDSVRRADQIIAVSAFTRAEILRLLPVIDERKVTVIPEAADDPPSQISNVRSPAIQDLKSKINNCPFALFVGTFEPRKNLPTLLRALKELPGDLKLVIVGERGWGNQQFGKLARELGVSERVFFAGRLTDAEVGEAYCEARMLVLPSLSEGFGLPVLEAMSRGTPVVCSNAGALPEVAGDAALLHDPLDASALARLMRMMWTINPVHDDYARRGRERAAQFSWAKAASQTWELYTG